MSGMKRRSWLQAAGAAALLPPGLAEGMQRALVPARGENPSSHEKREGGPMPGSTKVYELRIYHAAPGKLDELVARFRDHTDKLFLKHGLKSLAYWTALDEPAKHPSREAATANWKAFQDDPEWQAVKAKSEENGKLAEKIDSTYLTPTDFPQTPRI